MTTSWVNDMNHFGRLRRPFVFLIDFEINEAVVIGMEEVDQEDLLFDFNGKCNFESQNIERPIQFEKISVSFDEYEKSFDIVKQNLQYGNSYLLNLTFPTEIKTNYSLKDIFFASHAKYKLWYKNRFVVFSPEIFVQIKNNHIYSYPMKGTIDAGIPNAEDIILADKKEIAEHNTIVDLIRNDLSMVAKKVRVDRFRYIDKVNSIHKNLLQVSSQISGDMKPGFNESLGTILFKLLPAGSISGAPKKKTLEIIKKAENYKRGFYTGICGYWDGYELDSGVMIRFIERENNRLFYKSGGGITVNSIAKNEYDEMIDKVYVPIV